MEFVKTAFDAVKIYKLKPRTDNRIYLEEGTIQSLDEQTTQEQ